MKNILFWSAVAISLSATKALAVCPDCISERATLAEEIEAADAAVIARLVKAAPPFDYGPNELGEFAAPDPDAGKATFAVVDILRGDDILVGVDEFAAVFFGEPKDEELYLVTAIADPLDWAIPIPISQTAADYIRQLDLLPVAGIERLRFFLKYLQHEDTLLALDAYEEFARAPYEEVLLLKDDLDREKLRKWIRDPLITSNRRSLYFVLLGICGQESDIEWLEEMIVSDRRRLTVGTEVGAATAMAVGGGPALVVSGEAVSMELNRLKNGFRAMIGCYLKLRGPEGLELVDEHVFRDPVIDTTEMHSALMALRTAAEETKSVPLPRITESMRLALGHPDFADQAITDLARWEDWSVTDRLIAMFREPSQNAWSRQAIVAYLDLAAQQPGEVGETATAAVKEFEQLDPKAVKNARTLASFGFLAGGSRDTGDSIPPNAMRPTADSESPDAETDAEIAADDDILPIAISDDLPPNPEAESSNGVDPTDEPPIEAIAVDEDITSDDMSGDVTTDRDEAAPVATPAPTQVAEIDPVELPSNTTLVGVPLLGAAALVVLFYFILRGGI